MTLSRRKVLAAAPWLAAIAATPALAEGDEAIHVVKDPGCPCCNGWIGHLRDSGFPRYPSRNAASKACGVQARAWHSGEDLASCHTATIGDYTVEGHVPAADIRRLLAERPVAVGLSVRHALQVTRHGTRDRAQKPMTSSLSGWTAAVASSQYSLIPFSRARTAQNQ